jgi:hypothetical protein
MMSPEDIRKEEKRIRLKVLESNFRYPAPKAPADFIVNAKQVSEARSEGKLTLTTLLIVNLLCRDS